jgi:hypothetical protein
MVRTNYGWKSLFAARCCINLLNMNESHRSKLEMYQELGFPPLPEYYRQAIETHYQKAKVRSWDMWRVDFQKGQQGTRQSQKQKRTKIADGEI